MSNNGTKSVNITVDKSLSERLSLIRKFKGRCPEFAEELEKSLLSVVAEFEKKLKLESDTWLTARKCPECSSGMLIKRTSRKGSPPRQFMGCSNFPKCTHSESIKK
tara:strand:+ start:2954 stop:3271 length:318 start_codon:yes stop_codon:yes gene_type:complete